jgi:hypothetical protein
MAIQNPQPDGPDGSQWPLLAPSLSLQARAEGPVIAVSLAVTLTPYQEGDDIQMLPAGQRVLIWGDAVEASKNDPKLARFLNAIEAAGQAYLSEVV